MAEYLHAPENPQRVLDRLTDPTTRIVSLTITEGGYNIDETTGEFRLDQTDVRHDLSKAPPRTAFGFIVLALEARRKAGLQPLCYPSLSLGHRFVHEGMEEARIVKLLQSFWDFDTFPLVAPPTGYSVRAFTAGVLSRFSNPAIRDQLLRVAHDGAAKIMVFHAKTIRELIENGKNLTREAFMLACFSRYLLGVDDLAKSFEVNEPQFNEDDWRMLRSNNPTGLLGTTPFRSLDLEGCGLFREQYLELSHKLTSDGCNAALDAILV